MPDKCLSLEGSAMKDFHYLGFFLAGGNVALFELFLMNLYYFHNF